MKIEKRPRCLVCQRRMDHGIGEHAGSWVCHRCHLGQLKSTVSVHRPSITVRNQTESEQSGG